MCIIVSNCILAFYHSTDMHLPDIQYGDSLFHELSQCFRWQTLSFV